MYVYNDRDIKILCGYTLFIFLIDIYCVIIMAYDGFTKYVTGTVVVNLVLIMMNICNIYSIIHSNNGLQSGPLSMYVPPNCVHGLITLIYIYVEEEENISKMLSYLVVFYGVVYRTILNYVIIISICYCCKYLYLMVRERHNKSHYTEINNTNKLDDGIISITSS